VEVGPWQQRFVEYLHSNWETDDGAHDLHHLHRVWRTCQKLNRDEGEPADKLVLLAACYFHDYVTLPKNDPARHQASSISANAVAALLSRDFPDFPADKIPEVHHAIHAHSFSAGVQVQSIEASILQDADRMEALGAIGIARLFYTAGKMGSNLFDPEDVLAEKRDLDDRRFALDHIEIKLLKLPSMMNTAAGRKMAEDEAQYLCDFRVKMAKEAVDG
jgi:uncharacterized protein